MKLAGETALGNSRNILLGLALLGLWTGSLHGQDTPLEFQIRATPEVHQQPYTGRVYVFFGPFDRVVPINSNRMRPPMEPLQLASNWFNPQPVISWDVQDWKPGEVLSISWGGPRLHVYPPDLQLAQLRQLAAQPVVRFNPLSPDVPNGTGNATGKFAVAGSRNSLVLDVTYGTGGRATAPLVENATRKLLEVRSSLLTDHQQREVVLRAAVHLPEGYDAPGNNRRYPVIIEIPGFGGDHRRSAYLTEFEYSVGSGVDVIGGVGWSGGGLGGGIGGGSNRYPRIHVILDPRCPLGHHVFANSENNGPWGDALVQEFLPELDRQFRTVGTPASRYLCGHSSGGWSSLWLMVNYPEHFGGVWSTAPDPVDFRDFQRINVYSDANMYRDAVGAQRPLARRNGQVALTYEDFCRREDVLGPGGQLHSFEAVFSPRGADGKPRLLWNRETGAIDHAVAETWKKYDIRLLLEENWATLGPKLKGKLHVYMGSEDTFYLDGATVLLKQSLEQLGSDAAVEIFPGRDHSNLLSARSDPGGEVLLTRIVREMIATYQQEAAK